METHILGPMDVLRLFRDHGALLDGHFSLSSGLHSAQYMQCAMILQHPELAERLGRALAVLAPGEADTVIGPAMGGLIIGHEVARSLNRRFIFTERNNGVMSLRRGLNIRPGERVLIVDDVITTGGSSKEVYEVARASQADIIGILALVDRSSGKADFGGVAVHSLVVHDIPNYKAQECPLCRQGLALMKPGSREK